MVAHHRCHAEFRRISEKDLARDSGRTPDARILSSGGVGPRKPDGDRPSSTHAMEFENARYNIAMSSTQDPGSKVVYWHEELPPLDGEVIQENTIEAMSDRVPGAIERHGELWQRCYTTLM